MKCKKGWMQKLREAFTRPAMTSRLETVEFAAELELIDKKRALINKELASGAQRLISSIEGTPNAIINMGSTLIIKMETPNRGEIIIAKSLTQEQQRIVDANPNILYQPQNILKFLAISNSSSTTIDSPLNRTT